jgi:uncharacterized protein YbjT (DUF2867 family)
MKVVVIGGTGLIASKVVVDVANSPSFEDGPAWDFFNTATGNVLTTAESAGVSHVVALSVVGSDRLLASGYFRAKDAQEKLVKKAAIPFSIVRATQFHEFVGRTAIGQPVGGILEVTGPDRYPLEDLVRARLRASNDTRRVVTDPQSRHFGVVLDDHTLVPGPAATVFPTRFEDWLVDNAPAPVR